MTKKKPVKKANSKQPVKPKVEKIKQETAQVDESPGINSTPNLNHDDANEQGEHQEVQPSIGAYAQASLQLLFGWIKLNKLKTLTFIFVPVLIIGIAVAVVASRQPVLTSDEIVTKVSRELGISGDGNPVIMAVVDNSKIEQPFLVQAKNDDKVILYYKAKKAVLYRPSESRIVHSGAYTPPEAKVFIRNGTSDPSNPEKIKDKLKGLKSIKVTSEDTSPNANYSGITIVSVTDRYDEEIRTLEKIFDTKVMRLPPGESFPDADILIIVGK